MDILAQFPDVLDVRFKEVFYDRFDKVQTTYDKVVQTITSGRNYEKFSSVYGVGEFQKLGENETVIETDMGQDFDKTFTAERYSNSAAVSKDLLDDDQYGVIAKRANSLAMSAKRNIDENMAQMFYRGFTATNKAGDAMVAADGVRHFSTLHYKNADETGTVYSNASDAGLALNETNLETGLIAVQQQLNQRGKLGYFKADTLLVPRELLKTAKIILDSEKRSDTANNDINVYMGEGIKIVCWDQLSYGVNASVSTSNTHWYLLDSTAQQFSLIMREMPNFSKNSPIYVDENRYWKWVMDMRYSYGLIDWRGSWGSIGDGNAYSS